MWKRLHHRNVAPLLGITSNFGPLRCIGFVSPWMEQGNLNDFLKRKPLAMRQKIDLVRVLPRHRL